MSNSNKLDNPIPGMDVIGRGVHLVPHQPYELKGIIFEQSNWRQRFCPETSQNYSLPEGYEINDSPPMPSGVSLNQVSIEESVERLDKANQLDASISGGNGAFSINANASRSDMMRRSENAYYATRTSFIPFWTVYISDNSKIPDELNQIELPVPFKHAHRKEYARFFQRFGSHFIKRVWVGGRATLTFSVLKSSEMSEQEIRMGIQASFGSIASTQNNQQQKEERQKLANNAECTVAGKGGDAQLLAALSTLDEAAYNGWMQTIKDNPQSIELEVSGIWTLIAEEQKAEALKSAYMAATSFDPISAVFRIKSQVYFIREGTFSSYDVDAQQSKKPQPLTEQWPQLQALGFDRIDAALSASNFVTDKNNLMKNKVFFFKGKYCVSLDTKSGEFGEVVNIEKQWPGVQFDRVDAALHFDDEAVYLFSGKQYVRFDVAANRVDDDYPQLISDRWEGLHFDKIDAAVYWGNGKVYFFREDRHIRYDITDYQADPGYPKFVIGSYVEDWKLFV